MCVCCVCWSKICVLPRTSLPPDHPPPDHSPPDRPIFFSFFSPSPATIFFLFSLLVVLSWNFGGVFEGRDPQMCTFGLSGSSLLSVGVRGRPSVQGGRRTRFHQCLRPAIWTLHVQCVGQSLSGGDRRRFNSVAAQLANDTSSCPPQLQTTAV